VNGLGEREKLLGRSVEEKRTNCRRSCAATWLGRNLASRSAALGFEGCSAGRFLDRRGEICRRKRRSRTDRVVNYEGNPKVARLSRSNVSSQCSISFSVARIAQARIAVAAYTDICIPKEGGGDREVVQTGLFLFVL